MNRELKERIKEQAGQLGFSACGITTADDFPEYSAALNNLIKEFPETEPLYTPMYRRGRIKERFPWAGSIIVCIRGYGRYRIPPEVRGHIGRNYLFDCRVPENPDYQMIKNFTQWLRECGMKVRKGGVPDRLAAQRAGVGSMGRNNFVYTGNTGSWINIISYIVDVEIEPDEPSTLLQCPQGCNRCVESCPTGALVKPYTMRMDRCIAYLTYQAPLPLDRGLESRMGAWVYGCDVCQESCPLNKDVWKEEQGLPYLEKISPFLTPEALGSMDEETYRKKVHPLFYYIKEEDIERWHKNAGRAIIHTSNLTFG